MRGCMLFVVGILVGLVVQTGVAQNLTPNRGVIGLNHVGINVPNIDETVEYYTKTLGFPEAFRGTNPDGQIRLVYIQISKNTFVELQPANGRPAGINHFGIQIEKAPEVAAMFRQRGAKMSDTRTTSTGAINTDITDLNDIRIELAELRPESDHWKAMERWK